MKPSLSHTAAIALCAAWMLPGCSQQGAAPASGTASPQASAESADVARNLDTYRQLLRIHNDEMAVTMGKDIVSRYPDSAAAKEVQQTLPEIEQRYTVASEKNRLAALWLYQVSPMAGGTQSTATIVNSLPSGGADRVQLVLRRHTSWGQSAFLYGSKPGFVCRGNCTLAVTVDGKPVHIKAFAPPTGEPALMMVDDKGFIAMLQKARKIGMDVTFAEGEKKQTLVYEVGGFDPTKWASVGKGKKK
ncbi:hypothetical protein [Rhodanobacter sp. C01]|uniref:hypothetical protein n=1 Tax=Rhodanobacter sp. C01 TaxID=1945856 RepID=UPI0009857BA5|nr:hypothetical protein [Rhodanobacter sp. C01]OOG51301.1 hypothetical protein B0E50_00880 [Rhodanobacter sp. C01]